MKKLGFTLIELLAVILILGIIALIAIPTINNIIVEAKLGSKVETMNGILDVVENYYMIHNIKDGEEIHGTIIFNNAGQAYLEKQEEILPLEFKGEKPIGGFIHIDSSGDVSAESVTFSDGFSCTMSKGQKGCMQVELDANGNVISNETIKYIKNKVGSSLIDDPYDDNTRMIFRGDSNIHNYIYIKENGEDKKYRIISIESDGTIKIIREQSVYFYAYDKSDVTRANADNTYCNYSGAYYGCNAWGAVEGEFVNGNQKGTVTKNATLNNYLNNVFYGTLDSSTKDIVVFHLFDIGGVSWQPSITTLLDEVKSNKWRGNIGLITIVDWFNASNDTNCNPANNGWVDANKSNSDEDYTTNYPCSNNNYLYKSNLSRWWTMTPVKNEKRSAYSIWKAGFINNYRVQSSYAEVRPTFYITSNVKIDGEGTNDNPFTIESK